MDRRDFLKSTGGAAAAAAVTGAAGSATETVAAPSIVSGARELRLALSFPDSAGGPSDSARRLARAIETATEGRYRFLLVETERRGLDVLSSGEAELYHGSEHDNLAHHPAFAYFAGLPGRAGLRSSALEAWMIAGGGQMLWDDLAGEHGVKALLAGHTGRSIGLLASRPLKTLGDLSGARVWGMGLLGDVVRGLGAEPVTHSARDLDRLLASGDVVAAEAGGAISSFALGLLQRLPHVAGFGINRTGTALSLGMKRELWTAMSPSDQAIVRHAASAELHTAIAEERTHRRQLMAGLTVPPEAKSGELASAVTRVSDAVIAHLAATDTVAARVDASFGAFRAAIGLGGSFIPAADV